MLSDRVPYWRNEILEPVWRFPLPAIFAVLLTMLNWQRSNMLVASGGEPALSLYCVAAFFWTWAAALWAEARSDRRIGLLAGLGGAVLLALIFRLDRALPLWLAGTPAGPESGATIPQLMLLGALVLGPSLAPYLSRAASQSAFWQYNHKWVIGYLVALLGAALAFAGVASIIGSVALLLEVSTPRWVYADVWLVCSLFVLPWVWLALAPEDFSEEARTGANQEFTSRAIGLLVVYILIPVTFAMSAVLAAYVVKVVVQGTFSEARLGLTSIAYGASVILVMLMAYPQRQEHPLVGLFWRSWPLLLIAPSLLLAPTLWIRIADHGWTPPRYLAVLLAVWIVGVTLVGLLMRREEDLRLITGLLALLLLVSAFGPWGIADVSARSQAARLEALLAAKGLLKGGHWRETPGPIVWDRLAAGQKAEPGAVLVGDNDRKIASSALDVLAQTGRLDRLRPWFEGQPDNPFQSVKPPQTAVDAVKQKLALSGPFPQGQAGARILLNTASPIAIALPGEPGTLIGPVSVNVQQRLSYDTVAGPVSLALQGKHIEVRRGEAHIASFDLTATLDSLMAESAAKPGQPVPVQHKALMLEEAAGAKARLAITYLSAGAEGAPGNIQATLYLLLPVAP